MKRPIIKSDEIPFLIHYQTILKSKNFQQYNMTDIDHFTASTRFFNESKFLEGLEQIDRSIEQDPHNSVLYSNRALFLVELGHIRQAIKDLKQSIELDYLNYVAYFNLFSIYVRQNSFEYALQDLHCALSAAYLIVGKQNKSYEFVVKAVEYASNNTEARVLKGLMQLEQGKFKEAHEQLVWACGIQTDNNILAKVRDLIKKIGDSVQRQNEEQSSTNSQRRQTRRLESSYQIDSKAEIQSLIRDRVLEFNQIYQIISDLEGIVTEKIGNRDDRKEIFIRQRSSYSNSKSNTEKEQTLMSNADFVDKKSQKQIQSSVVQEVVVEKLQSAPETIQQSQEVQQVQQVQEIQKNEEVQQVTVLQSVPIEQTIEHVQVITDQVVQNVTQQIVQDLESVPQQKVQKIQEIVVEYATEKVEEHSQISQIQNAVVGIAESTFQVVDKTPEFAAEEQKTGIIESLKEKVEQVLHELEAKEQALEKAVHQVVEQYTHHDKQSVQPTEDHKVEQTRFEQSKNEELHTPAVLESIQQHQAPKQTEEVKEVPEKQKTLTFFQKVVEQVKQVIEDVKEFVQEFNHDSIKGVSMQQKTVQNLQSGNIQAVPQQTIPEEHHQQPTQQIQE